MPGRRKFVWEGVPLPGDPKNGFEPLEEFGREAEMPIIIPEHDPGRVIMVKFSREQARDIGMRLWKWGSE